MMMMMMMTTTIDFGGDNQYHITLALISIIIQ